MFEAGFLEMLVVGIVALLVIGPERLPKVARTIGRWLGKARAFIANTRADIERELKADEMRAILQRQEEELRQLRDMVQQNTDAVRQSIEAASKPDHDAKT